jgi:hypothetical protein
MLLLPAASSSSAVAPSYVAAVAPLTVLLLLLRLLLVCWPVQEPGGQPVWRQILRFHLRNIDPAVAQHAAAALAE